MNGKFKFIIFGLLITCFLPVFASGCTTAGSGAALAASKDFYRDIPYGESAAQKIDIALPDKSDKIHRPLNGIIAIHGGGWQEGDKGVFAEAIKRIAKAKNVLAASVNYRLIVDGATCEDMLSDIGASIAFIKQFAQSSGFSINKIALLGVSAGAHLSLLYTYKHYSDSALPVSFCAGMSTPTDMTDTAYLTHGANLSYILGCVSGLTGQTVTAENFGNYENLLFDVSPVKFVRPGIPPTVLAYGAKDELIPPSNAETLNNKLESAGAEYYYYEYPNSGHGLFSPKDTAIHIAFFTKVFKLLSKV